MQALKLLKRVRKDSKYVVFAGHPDHIGPRELSGKLQDRYGPGNFNISLRNHIYVIHVEANAERGGTVSLTTAYSFDTPLTDEYRVLRHLPNQKSRLQALGMLV